MNATHLRVKRLYLTVLTRALGAPLLMMLVIGPTTMFLVFVMGAPPWLVTGTFLTLMFLMGLTLPNPPKAQAQLAKLNREVTDQPT